jgi:hypothetical protein
MASLADADGTLEVGAVTLTDGEAVAARDGPAVAVATDGMNGSGPTAVAGSRKISPGPAAPIPPLPGSPRFPNGFATTTNATPAMAIPARSRRPKPRRRRGAGGEVADAGAVAGPAVIGVRATGLGGAA